MKDKHKTLVTFKRFDDGEIIAIFPTEKWDFSGNVASYMHIGQHGGASIDLLKELSDANAHERIDLKKELESIGYNLLEATL